jgi:hypothetical protein
MYDASGCSISGGDTTVHLVNTFLSVLTPLHLLPFQNFLGKGHDYDAGCS